MAALRISPTEVQVGVIIYTFSNPDEADEFEACVATVSLTYCTTEHPALSKRRAEPDEDDPLSGGQTGHT
jgi:hypothetical protein